MKTKKQQNFRALMDNEARLKALCKGINSPFKMKNPCWKGYEAIGMKTLKGKKVPNCVPKK